ncbi:MAG: hypothetical protein K2X74_14015, partial [Acetobacteraceae bacterium]|nr:hypothetical protein [Acetobacteraceae bacterium]
MHRRSLLLGATALAGCGGVPHAGGAPAQTLAGGGAAPGSARFQTAGPDGPPANAILPVPMPCADHPGDILGLVLDGMGSPANLVAVFGQAFRAGDLPRGAGLRARMADSGRLLRTQADVTTRYPDGSARFAVVSVQLAGPLPAGDRLGLVLASGPGGAEAPALDTAAALAGRQAVVEIAPAGGGAPWRFDLLANAPRSDASAPRNGVGG